MIKKRKTRKLSQQHSLKEREAILKKFYKSGQSARKFASLNKITHTALYKWKRESTGSQARRIPTIKRGGPYDAQDRKQAVEAYLKSGLNQKNFAKTWGCSEITLSRWVSQYKKFGHKGLEKSSFKGEKTKRRGPKGISKELKKQIVETKTQNDTFGIRKIKDFLRRFRGVSVCTRTISKTLKEKEIPFCPQVKKRNRSSDKIRTFERAQPMQLWQTDITSYVLTRQSQRVYFTVFMDDCSRYIVSWSLQLMQTGEFVMNTLLNGVQKFGKPEEVLTDQGRQYFAWRGKSKFQNLLIREGIEHVVARSHHPQTVGKCERFWETVAKEFWERVRPQELSDARERIGHFINYYNHFRPHQGLDGMVPADRFFGVESEVRKVIEETVQKNSLRLAIDEAPRSPVFLIGQIGNTPLSMHGESGNLILQTPDGSIQRLCYENFGHNLTKGVSNGTESGDNERTKNERATQGIQDSRTDCTSSENALETSDSRGESESTLERGCVDGILDRKDEQNGDCEEIGDSSSENLATLSASYLWDACRPSLTTENESERTDDEYGRRSEKTQEENCGTGNHCRETESFDSDSSNDAGLSRHADTDGGTVGEGEAGCENGRRDIEENFEWPWQNYFARKEEEGET